MVDIMSLVIHLIGQTLLIKGGWPRVSFHEVMNPLYFFKRKEEFASFNHFLGVALVLLWVKVN